MMAIRRLRSGLWILSDFRGSEGRLVEISAFSLACRAIQVVGLSIKAVSTCRGLYGNGESLLCIKLLFRYESSLAHTYL